MIIPVISLQLNQMVYMRRNERFNLQLLFYPVARITINMDNNLFVTGKWVELVKTVVVNIRLININTKSAF